MFIVLTRNLAGWFSPQIKKKKLRITNYLDSLVIALIIDETMFETSKACLVLVVILCDVMFMLLENGRYSKGLACFTNSGIQNEPDN